VRGTTITPTEKACNGNEPQVAKATCCRKHIAGKSREKKSKTRQGKQKLSVQVVKNFLRVKKTAPALFA
jgi:hypothetical protein